MIKTIKVMLCSNKKQRTKFVECAGVTRFVYNWVLDCEKISYECDNSFVSNYELRKRLTELKKTHSRFMCLNNYSNNIVRTNAWVNFLWQDKKTLKRNSFGGIGKPEPLKNNLRGLLSRRIDDTNRIVYYEKEGIIYIIACRGHYD